MGAEWVIIAVMTAVALFLLVWALCHAASMRDYMEEMWRHPPDSEVKDDENDTR